MIDLVRFAISRPAAALAALLLGFGVVLSGGAARARPLAPQPQLQLQPWNRGVTPAQMAAARRLFDEANTNLSAGLITQAAEKYRQAVRLWPHPIIHYNLALTQIVLDELLEADGHLEEALAHGPGGLGGDLPKLEYAKQKRAELGHRFATVQVTCRTEGAKIFIDREHVLTIERGKRHTISKRIRIDKQSIHRFEAELPDGEVVAEWHAVVADRPLRVELQEHKEPRWKSLTWQPGAVVSIGVLFGVAGGMLQWSANASYRRYEQELAKCIRCHPSDFGYLLQRGDRSRALGIAGFGIAGVAIVTGGIAAYLNRPLAHPGRGNERNRRQLSVAPLVAPGGAGALVTGRF